jgi:hypothetical protein
VTRFVDEFELGFGWIAPEPKFMQRCSHALAVDGRVWLIDPVLDDEALDRAASLGEPAGVLVLFERHERDASAVARRLGVQVEQPVAAPFDAVPLGPKEVALWHEGTRTLLVPEALGSVQLMRAPGERIGVHPSRRLRPPRELARFSPEHVLFGHGEGVHGPEAAPLLHDTLRRARRRAAAWVWAGFKAHALKRR